ncbi:SDR family NAD(P)-dependent oxidoreductase [Cryptosporangium sp. NPDC048952]|uniref:SDR family NAD(P)-dependent oxidoreductase n=1 Tax=Cryptosporangium sp. NPDC048952 TaxID=3363961 RepID=UPI003720A9C2
MISVVTGAAGGMGRIIVRELARRGDTVVAVTRSVAQFEHENVEVMTADLSSLDDVRRLAAQITARHGALHLLVNNAGAHFRDRVVNADGVEMHIAVNHLGGFALTNLLLPTLLAGAPARVVNVVSAAMTDTRQMKIGRHPRPVTLEPTPLTDLNGEAGFEPFTAYARAKLLTLMAGYRLAETTTGVTVNAVNPGVAGTKIVDDMMPAFMKPFGAMVKRSMLTPEQGADAILRVATDPDLEGVTGRYFDRETEARSPEISYDRALQEWVWTSSATITG